MKGLRVSFDRTAAERRLLASVGRRVRRRAMACGLLSEAARRLDRPVRVRGRTFWGGAMTLELPEPISVALFEHGYIEEGLSLMLLRRVADGMVFFDVGAHAGYYSLLASRLVGGSGRVVAFEPTPRSLELLRSNVSGRANVVVEPVAAWSEDTRLTFNDYGFRFSALNSVYAPRSRPDEDVPAPATFEVEATTLDAYSQRTGLVPDFVKIDAESAEREVLIGMERLLAEARPIVSVEVGDVDVPGAAPPRDVLAHLVERGYTPLEYRDGDFVEHRLRDHYGHGNIILTPRPSL